MIQSHSPTLPPVVAWLGYGGLLPFLALASGSWLDQHHGLLWSDALFAYGAIILSFVGALHWGLAMSLPGLTERQRSACFAWSVVPALLAWPALMLPAPLAAALLVAGFIAHYLQDSRLARRTALPSWYLPLRQRLSGIAIICLLAGMLAA